MRRLLLLAILVRCGGPEGGTTLSGTDSCPPTGSIVITELAIRGSGYVEVYNAGRRGIELEGLDVSIAGAGAPRAVHVSGRVGAGRYAALPVSALADAGGTVALSCAGQTVDEVRYGRADSDVLGLDGSQPPDASFNDSDEHWCTQSGTAGGPNPACGAAACDEGETPARGDLVLSEVMRDPAGADADHEWIELRNASDHTLILDGLVLEEKASSTRRFTLTAPACFALDAGALIVLSIGGDDAPFLTRGSGLFNDLATLTLRIGATVVDEAEVDCGRDGTSCALVDDTWCEATTPTPGEDNSCAS